MRILCVMSLPPDNGGSAISVAQLLSKVARRGHAVSVLAPLVEEHWEAAEVFGARHPELKVVRYSLQEYEPSPFQVPPAELVEVNRRQIERHFTKLVETARPDLVVIGRESYARYVPELARRHGVPSVLLVRGSPTAQIVAGRHSKDDAARLLELYGKADAIIAVADHLKQGLHERGLTHAITIPNAIDLERFQPREKGSSLLRELRIGAEEVVVAAAMKLVDRKRPFDLVASAETVLRQDRRVIYLVLGSGPAFAATQDACRARGLADRFRFTGWIDYERMPEYLGIADILVQASDAEGMSRACLEALACGLVLVASDIPATRELIEDGINGVSFRLADVDDLAEKTLRAVGDEPGRRQMGRRARESVRGRDIDAAVTRYLAEFRAVVEGASTKSPGARRTVSGTPPPWRKSPLTSRKRP